MKKSIILAIALVALLSSSITINGKSTIAYCNGYVSAHDEITMYDEYDGNIYVADTGNIKKGTKVSCKIDTKGTKKVTDDVILKVSRIK